MKKKTQHNDLEFVLHIIQDKKTATSNKLRALINEAKNFDEISENLMNLEKKIYRLKLKELFLELFKQQSQWEDIEIEEGHFIFNPDTNEIYNITRVFCHDPSAIQLEFWLCMVGGNIFNNGEPEVLRSNLIVPNNNKFRRKISELSIPFYKAHISSTQVDFYLERLQGSSNVPNTSYPTFTEENYFLAEIGQFLLLNPIKVVDIRINETKDDCVSLEILDEKPDVLGVYRFFRESNTCEQAIMMTIQVIHSLLYLKVSELIQNRNNKTK